MADIADIANEQAAHLHKNALKNRKKEAPKTTGVCLFCEEKIAKDRRFCDADCRDDYEKHERLQQHRRVNFRIG